MDKELRRERSAILSENPPIPRNMMIELTNICNHKCVFCNYQTMKRPKRLCDKQFTMDIMKQAYDLGTREVGFYLIGEPFVNPDIVEFISYAHEVGFEYIYLTTNGALATIDKMISLIDAGLNSIKFSVNAATPETYKLVHGKDDYLTVLKNAEDLRKYITDNNINLNVFLSFVKTLLTEHTMDKIETDFGKLVDKIYYYDCVNQGGAFCDLVEKGIVREGELKTLPSPCIMVFNRFHITCEGYLDACCADSDGMLAAADLHEMSLYDAWYCEEMRDIRRRFLENDLKGTICYSCVTGEPAESKPLNEKLIQY